MFSESAANRKRRDMKLKCKPRSGWLTVSAAVFCSAVSLILAMTWQSVFFLIMKRYIHLDPSSNTYKMWVKNPLPIYLEIYLFNFTNAEEFQGNKSVVPNFKEVGPFLFEENREKIDVIWNNAEETVTFNQTRKWIFLSKDSQDFSTPITNVNPIASTIAHVSRLWYSKLQRRIANALLNRHEHFLVTASAQDWLFNGIPDKFLATFEALRKVTDIPIPYNKFGWFYGRNESSAFDGVFTIKTGKSNLYDLGMLSRWNNVNKTEYYEEECALVRGSTGEIFPPLTSFQKNLSVFASEICSYVNLKYSGVVEVEGIHGYEYVGDESVFDNGSLHEENICFSLGESCASGARNLSSCKYGSPAYISFPHFYLADSVYLRKISGLNPEKAKHKFSLKVEPVTGVPLEANASFQINFRVYPYSWCDEFRDVPEIYIPMLWFRQTARMSEFYASILQPFLILYNYGSYVFLIISFLFSLVFL